MKPTKKELEEQLKKTTEELEKSKPAPSEPEPKEPTPSEPEPSEQKEPEKEPEPTPSEPAPSPDYKKKFKASARENQKIYAKNRKLNRAIIEANQMPDPTEEELKKEYKDWEVMSETERILAKEALISKRFRERIAKAQEEVKKIEKWEEDVDKFIDDPKTLIDNPDLEGKTEAFREFAKQEQHNSVPFNILVSAFLFEQSRGKTPKKGKMFETGTGGGKEKFKPKSEKLSLEEARILMKTDFRKYKELLKAGKIEMFPTE